MSVNHHAHGIQPGVGILIVLGLIALLYGGNVRLAALVLAGVLCVYSAYESR